MGNLYLDGELSYLNNEVANKFRVGVLGSTTFHNPQSSEVCGEIGRALSQIQSLVMLTGGVAGVGETVGRAFHQSRVATSGLLEVVHILPRGCSKWDYGVTLFAGDSMAERREVLGRLAPIYMVIEGGPGTDHEAEVAESAGAILLPVVRTGGSAARLYPLLQRPNIFSPQDWDTIASQEAPASVLAGAIARMVKTFFARTPVS